MRIFPSLRSFAIVSSLVAMGAANAGAQPIFTTAPSSLQRVQAEQPRPPAPRRVDRPAAPEARSLLSPYPISSTGLAAPPPAEISPAPRLAERSAEEPATSAPVSPSTASPVLPAGVPAGFVLRHLTNTIQGFRITGEIGHSEWPVYITRAQSRQRLSFNVGYLAAISVMPEASYLSVAVNDKVIGRANIIGTRGVRTASFDVPAGLLKPGFNSVRITAEHRHRVDCSLQATYELWTQIDPTQTGLVIPKAEADVAVLGDLAALPIDEQGALPIRAVTPERASMPAVERIIRAAQLISISGRFAQPVVDFGPLADGDYGLNLVVGAASEVATLADLDIGPVQGPRVVLLPQRAGRRATIVATGRNDAEVEEALRTFATAGSETGSPEGLRAAMAFPGYRLAGGERVKLRDLGLVSEEFSGRLFRAAFNVILPPDFYSADYAKASLDMAGGYSAGLDPESQILVSVNGRHVVSFTLGKSSGEVFRRNPMPLPLGNMRPGLNRIEIEAHLPAPADRACDPLAAVSSPKRFLFLDTTEIELPRIARIARMPDLAVTATGAFPYDGAGVRPAMAILSPSRETVGAAATLAAHLAIAAGRPIDFKLSLSVPPKGEGPALIVAPAAAVDAPLLESVGLKPSDLASAWRERMDNPTPPAPEALPRFEMLARHRLVLQRNFPAACHMPVPQGGFRQAERMAAISGADRTAVGVTARGAGSRDLYDVWDSQLRSQSSLTQWASTQLDRARRWTSEKTAAARDLFDWSLAPVVAPTAITQQASLVMAQSILGDDASDVRTLVTAPDAATLKQSIACLVDPRVWRQVAGRMAVLNMSDGQVVETPVEESRLISTQPVSIQNARLIMAGWFSLNSKIYVALALLMAFLLAFATTQVVRNVGRKNT